MANQNEDFVIADEVRAEIAKRVAELKAANPKLKKVYPVVVEGDVDEGEKPYYTAYLRQPSFPEFSKYMSLSMKDPTGAMRELAKDVFIDGDRELVKDDSLFIFGLMPNITQITETRKSRIVNLSSAGK